MGGWGEELPGGVQRGGIGEDGRGADFAAGTEPSAIRILGVDCVRTEIVLGTEMLRNCGK